MSLSAAQSLPVSLSQQVTPCHVGVMPVGRLWRREDDAPETIPNRQDGRCCAASAALLSPPTPSSKPRFLKPSCMPSCHAAWHMYFTRACYKIIPLLKSHHVLKSHDFRHFESSTTPCPNNVLRPHYMGPRGHAGPNLCRVDRPLSWSCCYLAVQIQA